MRSTHLPPSLSLTLAHQFKNTNIAHADPILLFLNQFAAQDESDQAMAAYRTASRLFPGSHIPWLGVGMEYLRTNHLHLALQYIRQAQEICQSEPLVLHELGVLHYLNGEYDDAITVFLQVTTHPRTAHLLASQE